MIELIDGNAEPTVADKLCMGPDCTRHKFLGCIIANNGSAPEVQARNYLLSLRDATIHQRAGRAGDLSQAEYLDLLRGLEKWELTNKVKMPAPAVSIDRPTLKGTENDA